MGHDVTMAEPPAGDVRAGRSSDSRLQRALPAMAGPNPSNSTLASTLQRLASVSIPTGRVHLWTARDPSTDRMAPGGSSSRWNAPVVRRHERESWHPPSQYPTYGSRRREWQSSTASGGRVEPPSQPTDGS